MLQLFTFIPNHVTVGVWSLQNKTQQNFYKYRYCHYYDSALVLLETISCTLLAPFDVSYAYTSSVSPYPELSPERLMSIYWMNTAACISFEIISYKAKGKCYTSWLWISSSEQARCPLYNKVSFSLCENYLANKYFKHLNGCPPTT